MESSKKSDANQKTIDEGEIFKSLSHEIRRKIIKTLGKKKELSFTDLKNEIGAIDSPTLSYHLRSLSFLVDQKNTQHFLTEIGNAALLLMDRIDQSKRISLGKNRFLLANIATILCWIAIEILIPFIIAPVTTEAIYISITIALNVCAQINFFIIWTLWGSSWKRKNL